MKISKLFHWLYCVVMMLPVFVLPIFALAVRSDNNFQPISVDVTEDKVADFNQLVNNGNFANGTFNFNGSSNASLTLVDDVCHASVIDLSIPGNRFVSFATRTPVIEHNQYFLHSYFKTDASFITWQCLKSNPYTVIFTENITGLNSNDFTEVIVNKVVSADYSDCWFNFVFDSGTYLDFKYVNIVNGTDLFGVEYEINDYQYKTYFPEQYYSFGNYDLLVDNYYSYTLNDTDFGSQTIYTLYKEVDTYFNYDNVFNFGTLYTWLEVNFFNGNAPLGFFIFWHLLIYWLLTSLLWLLFDVLMYVPQLIHRWLDKASVS